MRTIRQKHPDGCGIACIAMASRQSYDQVREVMFSFRTPEDRIQEWLLDQGVRTEARFKKLNGRKYTSLEFNALLGVNYRKEDGDWVWHWVIWDATAKKIRDPQRSNGKTRSLQGRSVLENLSQSDPARRTEK